MSRPLPGPARAPAAPAPTESNEVLVDLVAWLNERFARDDASITPETLLFAEEWVKSLGVLELIAWVEARSGRTIPDRLIRMDHFQTPEHIVERFFERSEEAA